MLQRVELIGYAAAVLTTVSFVPQVIKTWRSRSADDLSLLMLVVFTLGVFLWLVYGIVLRSAPIVAANAVTFVLAAALVVLKMIQPGRR